MLTIGIKELIQIGIALLIGGAFFYAGKTIIDWKEGYELSKQQALMAEATTGILNDDRANDTIRGKQGAALASGRERFKTQVEEANQNEPEFANRSAGVIPDSLRRAYRERRLERNRFGCVGEGCGKESSTQSATER